MSKFVNLENAHVFSKAVITPNMEAATSGNISAHTVQSKNIWAEPLPFLNSNDVNGLSEDKEFIEEGYGKVKFHYKKNVYNLTNVTNNNTPSNGYVGKIIINGKSIGQFINATDVIDEAGNIAIAYNPILYNANGEAVPSSEYIINSSNGLIYDLKSSGNLGIFNTTNSDGKTNYTLSFFTYEGKKVDELLNNTIDKDTWDETIKNIDDHIKDETIHVTTADKSKWNNTTTNLSSHESDTDIHVSSTAKNKWDTAASDIASHKSNTDIHVTQSDKTAWNNTSNSLTTHIKDNKIHVTEENKNKWNTAVSNIESHSKNTSVHITEEERNSWNNKVITTSADAITWDLNEFFINNINNYWVQSAIKYKSDVNQGEQYVYIPYAKSFYGEQDTDIDEVSVDASNQHERVAEAWINDVIENGKPKVQLVFIRDSCLTNELIRRMFWQLDINAGKVYGSNESIAKKYLKPGLTIRINTLLSDGITNSPLGERPFLQYKKIDEDIDNKNIIPTYTSQTWLGNKENSNIENEIIWKYVDEDGNTLETPEIGNTFDDSFSKSINWVYAINEQSQKLIEDYIYNINADIENIKRTRLTKVNYSTCDITNGQFSNSHCLNIDSSYLPSWKINKIKLPSPLENSKYLRVIIVPEDSSKPIERYTSTNINTTEWEFENLPIATPSSYWKFILVNLPDENDDETAFGDRIFYVISYYKNSNIKAGLGGNKNHLISRNINNESNVKNVLPQLIFESTPYISGDSFINAVTDGNKWNLSLNVQNTLDDTTGIPTSLAVYNAINSVSENLISHKSDNIHLTNNDRVTTINDSSSTNLPTEGAVKEYIDNYVINPAVYLFPYLSKDELKYYIIVDAWQNPTYISFADEVEDGFRLFNYRSWEKFHIKSMNKLQKGWRMFHNNRYLKSFKCDMPALIKMEEMFSGSNVLEYFEGDFSSVTSISSSFTNCNALHTIKCDFSSLKNGSNAFGSSVLKHVNCKFRDLVSADNMFSNAELTIDSIENIAINLPDVNNVPLSSEATKSIGLRYKIDSKDENRKNNAFTTIINKGWSINQIQA